MTSRVRRGSEKDRQLRGLGWRRVRRRRRSNAKQPEVWKRSKVWEAAGRELVARIVKHNGLYRAEVVRVRATQIVHDEAHAAVYWQPLRGLDFECPLALAMFLELERQGDPVRACYAEAKPYVEDESDWIPAPASQRPGVVRPNTGRRFDDQVDWMRYAYQSWQSGPGKSVAAAWQDAQQATSRMHRQGQDSPVLTMDMASIERRMIADMKAKAREAGAICPEIGSTRIYSPTRYNK